MQQEAIPSSHRIGQLIGRLMQGKQHKVYLVRKILLGKDFLAICLFGFIFSIRPLDKVELNHELIHAAQQKELLYLPFFFWYGLEWLILLLKYRDRMKAYQHIRFEKEAYRHQDDLTYLKKRKLFQYLRS